MKLSHRVKSISHLKANAPDMIREMAERREPVVLTVNGEARAVLQDIESFDQTQETLALLKILALAGKSVAAGKVRSADKAFARLRRRLKR